MIRRREQALLPSRLEEKHDTTAKNAERFAIFGQLWKQRNCKRPLCATVLYYFSLDEAFVNKKTMGAMRIAGTHV